MKITWWTALVMCLLSFVGFGVVVMFARGSAARRALVAMGVSGFLAILSTLMEVTS